MNAAEVYLAVLLAVPAGVAIVVVVVWAKARERE